MPEEMKLDEKLQAIADAAIELRDTGQQDWEMYVRQELLVACEACTAALKAIREAVNAAPVPTFDLSLPLDQLISEGGIEYLEIIGGVVKVKTADGWQVGLSTTAAAIKEAEKPLEGEVKP